jgi:hypothetical protein
MNYEKLKQDDNLTEAYIEVVRRVSTGKIDGKKANSDIENRYIEVVRRVSGGSLAKINPTGKRDGDLIGNAELGVLEVTRRLSGTAAAICEGTVFSFFYYFSCPLKKTFQNKKSSRRIIKVSEDQNCIN